jgi:hypothetical protein
MPAGSQWPHSIANSRRKTKPVTSFRTRIAQPHDDPVLWSHPAQSFPGAQRVPQMPEIVAAAATAGYVAAGFFASNDARQPGREGRSTS